jgi:hypothetical protein
MDPLDTVAPVFVDMAHTIVWATAATVDRAGEPDTRIVHPIWEWDGKALRGWVATSPLSPKAKHLERTPAMSFTYWHPNHDTCTVRCHTSWDPTDAGREALWQRFSEAPAPLGYVPSIIPGWDSPTAPAFGALELDPFAIRVLEGSKMATGDARRLAWRAD